MANLKSISVLDRLIEIEKLILDGEPMPVDFLARDYVKKLVERIYGYVEQVKEEKLGQPTKTCPRCNFTSPDFDGLGVLACDVCGYCTHPSITGGICDFCKKDNKDI